MGDGLRFRVVGYKNYTMTIIFVPGLCVASMDKRCKFSLHSDPQNGTLIVGCPASRGEPQKGRTFRGQLHSSKP